ncbi:hypothetical protein GUJ93_ZPchr0006g45043 [Zizania palustris]|uniref:Uncharacterized protein n=1 Tax=Zizania palustris TaxID=103762 RepID=A0A8J5SL56_ZIZPA|nr:hypothetical protein GUJ93_ZPchr0006g45043 [Zizania palustris]
MCITLEHTDWVNLFCRATNVVELTDWIHLLNSLIEYTPFALVSYLFGELGSALFCINDGLEIGVVTVTCPFVPGQWASF